MKKALFVAGLVIVLMACETFIVDPSINAVEADDLTVVSACQNLPVGGFDACRFREHSGISSNWSLFLPFGDHIVGGDVTVFYKDTQKSYAIRGKRVEIPWREIIGRDEWSKSHNGIALALATIKFKDESGIERVVQARGEARLLIVSESYSVMPIDSGFVSWSQEVKCKIQYSSAGRSAVQCK